MKIFADFVVSPYPPDVRDDGGQAIVGWHYGRRPCIRTVQRARDHHGGEDDHEQCPVIVGYCVSVLAALMLLLPANYGTVVILGDMVMIACAARYSVTVSDYAGQCCLLVRQDRPDERNNLIIFKFREILC